MAARLMHTIGIFALTVLFPLTVFGAGGATPNGRPFVEINGQIAEVKSDVSALEVKYQEIMFRVNALEGNLQGQIDALNSEISSLKDKNTLFAQQITDLVVLAATQGYDIQFALSEIDRLQTAIDALESAGGDQAAAIAALESGLAAVKDDVAANAAGLLGVIADAQVNSNLLTKLQSDVSDLQTALAKKQQDIGTSCQSGYYAYGVADNGSLLCRQDQTSEGVGALSRTTVYSYVDIDNIQETHCEVEVLGICLVEHTITYFGDRYADVFCPEGYTVAGGGFDTSIHDDIAVETSVPYGNGWSVYFDNRASGGTADHWGAVFATCLKVQ